MVVHVPGIQSSTVSMACGGFMGIPTFLVYMQYQKNRIMHALVSEMVTFILPSLFFLACLDTPLSILIHKC